MREKIPTIFTFILLLTAVLVIPVQAEPTDIILGSFGPNENYESYMEFSALSGEDEYISDIIEDLSNLTITACTENKFILSADKVFFLRMDWYIEGQPQTESEYDNIHFSIDNNIAGRYELIGKVIVPDGFRPAEGLQLPTVHVFLNIFPKDEKREIVNLSAVTPLNTLIGPEIVYKDDENYIENLNSSSYSQWIGVTSDLMHSAILDLDWDFSSVDISREGTYKVPLTIRINENFADKYFLADEIAHYEKTLYVSDRESWNFYITAIFSDSFTAELSRAPSPWSDLDIYYFESEVPLEEDTIPYSQFTHCDDTSFINISPGSISIIRSKLHLNKYYYFYFKTQGAYSNIICVLDDGTNTEYPSIEGNRDGGDSTETPESPEINQPAPPSHENGNTPLEKPPAQQPGQEAPSQESSTQQPSQEAPSQGSSTQQPGDNSPPGSTQSGTPGGDIQAKPEEPATDDTAKGSDTQSKNCVPGTQSGTSGESSENTESTPASSTVSLVPEEKVKKGLTEISGTRLSYLYKTYGDYIPFTGENITIKIPSSFLKKLDLKDSDLLAVQITRSDKLSFRLRILVNNIEVFPDSSMKVTVPISGHTLPDTLYLDGKKTDIEITEINGYASFEIQTSGFYELKYEDESAQRNPIKRKVVPAALLIISAAAFPTVYILLSKRKRVKK